ncbi:MAG: hypothetical protein U5L95_02585 [Candidatus Saccharibacteria bacterium]|nr:hypothetical protein [Candidatus Saccharibacteria bacterium]
MKNAQTILAEILKGQNGKGANFMGISEYTSKTSGEVANFVVNFGASYGNAKAKSVEMLNSLTNNDFKAIAEKFKVNNAEGVKYATNAGATKFLAEGKLPKEGTKARETALNGVKETKTLATVRDEMVKTMLDNKNEETQSAQSIAQQEKYNHLGRGIKQHKETEQYYFYANSHAKEVIVEGEYKKSNPNPETAQKNAISRYFKMF